ncbi:Uncharacterized protein - chloroplastic [Striga hermonthica]|uniref:Uncharacterized protein - chloroplastic n=1 Tax=Striga hermonthica TaxID=68872 RepID=A0A9N7NTG5_STRHE|nr:Uncharacterized protein - chloroplastic [Striga hermonthica]
MASMSAYIFIHTPKSHSLTLSRRPFKSAHFNFVTHLAAPIRPSSAKYRCRRSSVAVIRASSSSSSGVDVVTSAIRPGGAVESDKLPSDVRKRAMDAIDTSGRRVTIGDVASKAGLKLNEAQKALQALAADTNGFLEDDDSYILPVLLRFDGQPEVDEEGNILYRFPSLQRTAAPQRRGRKEYVGRKWSDLDGIRKFFKENKWKFSKTSSSERAMVIGLGGLNLFGVLILGSMLKTMTVSPSGFVSFVSEIFPLLQIYAGSFFAIPLIRWFFVQNKNAKIVQRNRAREQWARILESPDLSLRRKLLSARDMAQRTFIGKDRIVYSTEKDLYEQDYDAREWDLRFKEIEKSD